MKYISLAVAAVSAAPSITIHENGTAKTLFVPSVDDKTTASGNSMTIPHGSRAYLAHTNALGPDNFYSPNVNGGYWEYDVDLSQSGCSCNAAFYLISMPGKDWNGNPDPS